MPIRTMCLSGHRKYPLGSSQPEVSGRGMEIMEKALELAEDLGIRIIQLAGYDVYYEEGSEETRKRFAKNLKKQLRWQRQRALSLIRDNGDPVYEYRSEIHEICKSR